MKPNTNIKSKSYEAWIKYAALRDAAILELLYSTGMRINELVKLTEDNIDLISGTVIVKGKGRRKDYVLWVNMQKKRLRIQLNLEIIFYSYRKKDFYKISIIS